MRSLKLCLTSEGQQAVLAAMICLLVLQIFLDSTAALQVTMLTITIIIVIILYSYDMPADARYLLAVS